MVADIFFSVLNFILCIIIQEELLKAHLPGALHDEHFQNIFSKFSVKHALFHLY